MTDPTNLNAIASDIEALRETLLDLDRARSRAESLHEQSEALLAGLRVLLASRTSEEVFDGLLEVLQEVLGFEDAFVLVGEADGVLRTHGRTSPRFETMDWIPAALTRRAMERPVAVFDIRRVEEWDQQSPEIREGVTSALHIGLKSEKGTALLVCTHGERSFFGSEHVQLAERLAVLASQALHDAELRAALVEQNRFFLLSLEIMAIVDFEGCFRQANAAWEDSFGLSRDQLLSSKYIDHVLSEDRAITLQALQGVMHSGLAVADFENWIHCVKGPRRIAWRCSAVESEQLLYLVGRDITEAYALQRELVEARENAELASRSKSGFLASMSHELRTPLNAILGSCEALQEGVYGQLSETQGTALENVESAGRHQLDLINDLLDLSRIEAGGFEPVIESFSIVNLCHEIIGMLRPRASQSGVRLSISQDGELALLTSDQRRVRQMILNLLGNAIKFTHDGGRAGLDLERVGLEARVSIWDTGIGIPENELERLFQPFTQLDSALSRQHAGTGLGLNLTSKLAHMLGGRVDVESTVGQGSRFTICLPLRGATGREQSSEEVIEPPPEPPVEQQPSQPDGAHVLLVDDNPANLGHLKDYLEVKGHRVDLAYSGQEALVLAQANPDIIFMDVQMPGMDGIEAIHRLRADPKTQDLTIVSLTALATAEDRQRCIQAGANDYLSKPVSLRDLLKTVEDHVQ